jgi:N-acetylmuramoyl-L-alanine amidase
MKHVLHKPINTLLIFLCLCFVAPPLLADTNQGRNTDSVPLDDLADTIFGELLDLHPEENPDEDGIPLEDDGDILPPQIEGDHLFLSKMDFNRGRGLSEAPRAAYSIVERTASNRVIESRRLRYEYSGRITPTCIVLHRTQTRTFTKALRLMERFGFSVHFMIDIDGKVYQLMDSITHKANAARGIDNHAIHIEMVGRTEEDLLDNEGQRQNLIRLIKLISSDLNIEITNEDVESKTGVFSHNQVKRRYGGVLENDPFDPGYHYMYDILESAGGTFFNERQWKNRFSGNWYFHRTMPNIKPGARRTRSSSGSSGGRVTTRERKGRGLTTAPEPALPNLFATDSDGKIAERGRLRYWHYANIDVRGITLHFTANSSYRETIRVLENRGLRVQIIVAEDGTAYQSMDNLDERATGAVGFNSHCIQIEIVGRNEETLLSNFRQKEKVIALVKALVEKYDIVKNNYAVDANTGIFSHGQAKKRWGHSAWLIGTEFDPGEYYMKEIIETIGGKYYYDMDVNQNERAFASYFYEGLISDPFVSRLYHTFAQYQAENPRPQWQGRMSENWVFLPYPWTP